MKHVIAVLVAVLVAGCQTYDFERVTPMALSQESQSKTIIAKSLKPNVMLLVDTSGSMGDLGDPTSRISQLKTAMQLVLTEAGSDARFGLAVFPENNGPTQTIRQALPPPTANDEGTADALIAKASAINATIQSLPQPTGGTPTSASLAFLGQEPGLNDAHDGRFDFILLLTDGLPNLNPENPNALCGCAPSGCSQTQIDACACTYDDPNTCLLVTNNPCATGCLDQTGTVATIAGLANTQQLKTIVVGFGSDLTTGVAPQVLDQMARAGRQPRSCEKAADACGNEACGADEVCATPFYKATSADELARVLKEIIENIKDDVCAQSLASRPSDPRFVSVIVDGVTLEPGPETYTYDGDVSITMNGATCDKLKNSTPQTPVKLDIRAVEKL